MFFVMVRGVSNNLQNHFLASDFLLQPRKKVAGERERRMDTEEKFYSFPFNSNNTNTTTAKKPEAWSNRAGRQPGNRQAMAPLQTAAGNLARHSAALDTQPRESAHGNAGDTLHDGEDGHGEWIRHPLFHSCDPLPRVLVSG